LPRRVWITAALLLAVILAAPALAGSRGSGNKNAYIVERLVSDLPGRANNVDPALVNGWGLAALPTSPWWVADNGTNLSTLYKADGTKVQLEVTVANAPTGTVANAGPNFVVSEGGHSGPALFLFSTEEGTILGWNPGVATDHAVVAVDNSGMGSIYKGLAIAGDLLYATDFHNGVVHVWDGNFMPVYLPGAFVDPGLPKGYAPFGIQNVAGQILVTYAKQDADKEDEIAGPGFGFVDAYDTSGMFLGRVASRGALNAPWGLALAPKSFDRFGRDLLVGNFGDGMINAYEPRQPGPYNRVGVLKRSTGVPIAIDGLWAIEFGLGSPNNGPADTLFFTAGPGGERHGLFGSISPRR
jgi:uncharacterized protein (TIGR03118 family)